MPSCRLKGQDHEFELVEVVSDWFDPSYPHGHGQSESVVFQCRKCGYQLECEDYYETRKNESEIL
jgi:hypothetical protein